MSDLQPAVEPVNAVVALPAARPALGVIERRHRLVDALTQAGYEVMPQQDTADWVAAMRAHNPNVVGVAFRSRDIPLRMTCVMDDKRVSLRMGLAVRVRRRDCDEWNRTRFFTKAFADSDGELALELDTVVVEPWHEAAFGETVRIFVTSAFAAAMWFKERAQISWRDALRWAIWVLAGVGGLVVAKRLLGWH